MKTNVEFVVGYVVFKENQPSERLHPALLVSNGLTLVGANSHVIQSNRSPCFFAFRR